MADLVDLAISAAVWPALDERDVEKAFQKWELHVVDPRYCCW